MFRLRRRVALALDGRILDVINLTVIESISAWRHFQSWAHWLIRFDSIRYRGYPNFDTDLTHSIDVNFSLIK